MHSTGAREMACCSESKLAYATAVQAKRAVGLPSTVNGAASSA